jgi:hypothetical protein
MKISSKNSSSQLLAGLFTAVIAIFSAGAAHGQILLSINDTNSAAVVFAATVTNGANSAASQATVSSYQLQNGVDLTEFFSKYRQLSLLLSSGRHDLQPDHRQLQRGAHLQ